MKTPDNNERITRWLDHVTNPAETAAFRTEMERDPALRAEVAAMEKLGGLLRGNLTMERPVPHADFFSSQIQERIADLERTRERDHARPRAVFDWFRWLRTPWAVAGAAALITLGFVFQMR